MNESNAEIEVDAFDNLYLLSNARGLSRRGGFRVSLDVTLRTVTDGIAYQEAHPVALTISPGPDGLWMIEGGVFKAKYAQFSVTANTESFDALMRRPIFSLPLRYNRQKGEAFFLPAGRIEVFLDGAAGWGFHVDYPSLLEAIEAGKFYHGEGWLITFVNGDTRAGVISISRSSDGREIYLVAADVLKGLRAETKEVVVSS